MANTIRIKRSAVPGKVPLAADLQVGELAVNTADAVLYTKHTDGNVITISAPASGLTGNSNIYNTGIRANTVATLVDSVSTTGNTTIRWAVTAKDNVHGTVKSSTIDTVNDGTNVYFNEYGVLTSNNQVEVASFTSNISFGNVHLWATGDSANVTIVAQRVTLGTDTIEGYVNYATVGSSNQSSGSSGTSVNPNLANILYVSKNGDDSNDGSITYPYQTIKAALAAATSGTSVYVAPGTYTETNPVTIPANVSLVGNDIRSVIIKAQSPADNLFYVKSGSYVWGVTIKDYTANGFSYDPTTVTQTVYVSPYIQNITSSTTTGTAVKIDGSLTSSSSTKAMIVGFLTAINRGGKGVHITNSGYSQLVNIYTIANEVGVLCESGGFCTLNGSDSSIGTYGLKADGHGPELAHGNTYGTSTGGTFMLRNVTAPLHVNQVMTIDGDDNFYSIDTLSQVDGLTWQVSIQEIYSTSLPSGATVRFYQRSAIIASGHTFEYVGAGTDPATALPQYGGVPIEANEVVQTNGGRVTFTSTDHKGNFKIGANLTINQTTGTISGEAFSKSMFALMTPYILALQ
jgi:hypothetical protein